MKLDKIDRRLDLMNADGLDESIMNAVGGMTANYEYSSCCGVDGEEDSDADGDYADDYEYSNVEDEKAETKKIDLQKIADTTQTAASIAQSAGAIASNIKFSGARKDKRALRRELRAACGRRPILKKKRVKWQECADRYMKNRPEKPKSKPEVDLGGGSGERFGDGGSDDKFLGMPKTTGIIVAVVGGLALIGGGIFLAKRLSK